MRDKARDVLRASKLSKYYMSDSSSAFSLSAFCPPESVGQDGDQLMMSGQEPGDSERPPTKNGLEGLNLDIDKPMEELLILLGATRLHTDKGDHDKDD